MSVRSRIAAAATRADDGFFGPGSIFWRLCSRDFGVSLLGATVFMFPVFLTPSAGITWHRDRTYNNDPLAFLQRATNLILLMAFGDTQSARRSFERFQEAHETFNGRYAHDDARFRGMEAEGMLWTMASLWYSLFLSNQRFGRQPFTEEETEQYFAEGVVFARECGIPENLMPSTREEYRAYFKDAGDWILVVPDAATNIQRMMIRPDFAWLGVSAGRILSPLVWLFWRPLLAAPVSLLPARMQEMIGLRHWGRVGNLLNFPWRILFALISHDKLVRWALPRLVPMSPEGVGVYVGAQCPDLSQEARRGLPSSVAYDSSDVVELLDRHTPRVASPPESPKLLPRLRYVRRFFTTQREPLAPAE